MQTILSSIFERLLTLLIVLGLLATSLGALGPVDLQSANSCSNIDNYPEVRGCVAACGQNPAAGGSEAYSGYYRYVEECLNPCFAATYQQGAGNQAYLDCTETCESFVEPGYFECVNGCYGDSDSALQECLCDTSGAEINEWIETFPASCREVVEPGERPELETNVGAIFPECSGEFNTVEDLLNCIRAVINFFFFIAIAIFMIRFVYLAVLSQFSVDKSKFYKDIRSSIFGLIIGLVFIGMPVAIMNLINPNSVQVALNPLTEFSLGVSLIDTTPPEDSENSELGNSVEPGEGYNCEEEGTCDPVAGDSCTRSDYQSCEDSCLSRFGDPNDESQSNQYNDCINQCNSEHPIAGDSDYVSCACAGKEDFEGCVIALCSIDANPDSCVSSILN